MASIRINPGRTITVFQMCKIFTPAFLKAATPACATESFRSTGIWPLNPDVFTEADFLASSVTERENETDFTAADEILQVQALPQETANVAVNDVVVVNQYENGPKLPDSLSEKVKELQDLTPKESEKTITSDLVVSHLKQQKAHRKLLLLHVLSKDMLKYQTFLLYQNLELNVHIQENIKSPKLFLVRLIKMIYNVNQKRKESGLQLGKLSLKQENVEQSKPKTDKLINNIDTPKTKQDSKKTWICPGCGEIYKEPIIEDWIVCVGCNEWWHEECTAHIGTPDFVCDLCQ